MTKVIVFGAGKIGKRLIEALRQSKKIMIEGIADNMPGAFIEGYPMIDIEEKKYTDINVIVAIWAIDSAMAVYGQLKKLGYKNIFWYNGQIGVENKEFDHIELVSVPDWGECILPRVEMHIMDCCNLNCRGCVHFSPIFPRKIPNLDRRCNDIKRLKSFFSYIVKFYILGGEPLLNPQLEQYICRIREMLPETQIIIVTNGILIPAIDVKILESIQSNNIIVEISEYEPTYKIRKKITAKLEEYHIQYRIREYESKQKFNLPLTLSENSKYKQKCISDGCVNLYEGKIARCPTLMYIDQFNKVFHTDLPNDGIVDLSDVSDGKKILDILKQEVPLCKYCVENEIPWSCCGNKARVSDFAVGD